MILIKNTTLQHATRFYKFQVTIDRQRFQHCCKTGKSSSALQFNDPSFRTREAYIDLRIFISYDCAQSRYIAYEHTSRNIYDGAGISYFSNMCTTICLELPMLLKPILKNNSIGKMYLSPTTPVNESDFVCGRSTLFISCSIGYQVTEGCQQVITLF